MSDTATHPSTGPSVLIDLIATGTSLHDAAAQMDALDAEHGPGLVAVNGRWGLEIRTPGETCWCATCDAFERDLVAEKTGDWVVRLTRVMIVCPDCGNKRCPKATRHDQPCTGSNEPGQPGSAYA